MNPSTKNDLKMLVFALIIYAVIMGLTSAGMLNAFWQLNLIFAGINIILAASLNLINGYTGQFSLGHAGFMAIGAYVGVVLTTNFHLPFAAALLAGGAAAGLLGALIGLPTLRLRGDYLAIATLGLGEIVRIIIINVPYVGGAAGFKGIPHLTNFTWVFFLMLATLCIIKNFVNSRHGRACHPRERDRGGVHGHQHDEIQGACLYHRRILCGRGGLPFRAQHVHPQPRILYLHAVVQYPHHGRHGRSRLDDGLDRGRTCRDLRRLSRASRMRA